MEDPSLTGANSMINLPKPGDLLVAPPAQQDRRFKNAVMLICQYDSDGTFALTLNKDTGAMVEDIVTLPESNLRFPAYWGGPVAQHSVWLLHSPEWTMANTQQINREFAYTSHAGMFHHLNDGDAPYNMRMMFGYAGWAPMQLERELAGAPPRKQSQSWLIIEDPEPDFVWETPVDEMWDRACELSVQQAVDVWL